MFFVGVGVGGGQRLGICEIRLVIDSASKIDEQTSGARQKVSHPYSKASSTDID